MTPSQKKMLGIVILLIGLAIIIIPASYALYQGKMNINITTTTGGIMCDIIVDTNDDYIENNEPYFFITVNNFRENSGKILLTATDISYNLVIENQNGSNGLFRYVDEDGNTNNNPEERVVISNQYIGKTKTSKRYKVYVSSQTNLKYKVNFNVKLEANQKDMR